MRNLENLKEFKLSNNDIMKLIKLYQFKGKDFYYDDIMKHDRESVIRQTVEDECFEFVKFANLNLTQNRQNLIIRKNAKPKSNDEYILKNVKDIFTIFESDPQKFETITNEVYGLAKKLYQDVLDVTFTKTIEIEQTNLIKEEKQVSARKPLEKLLQKYESIRNSGVYEILYLIANFYVDFYNSKPFTKGNEYVSYFLLYILIFREKFNLFRYTSFLQLINLHKTEFDEAILEANFNYEEGFSNIYPLYRLIVDILLEGYNKVDEMTRQYSFEVDLNKSDNIENTIYKLPQTFTKEDIRLYHPFVSDSTINRTLKRLRDKKIIAPNGVGRSATWVRLQNLDRFNPDGKQLNFFDFGIMDDEE